MQQSWIDWWDKRTCGQQRRTTRATVVRDHDQRDQMRARLRSSSAMSEAFCSMPLFCPLANPQLTRPTRTSGPNHARVRTGKALKVMAGRARWFNFGCQNTNQSLSLKCATQTTHTQAGTGQPEQQPWRPPSRRARSLNRYAPSRSCCSCCLIYRNLSLTPKSIRIPPTTSHHTTNTYT